MNFLPTLLLVAVAPSGSLFAQDRGVRAAPFNAVRWSDSEPDSPQVRLGSEWFGWTAIDDVSVAEIVVFCKEEWPRKWRKRVGEDLVEALGLMDHDVGKEVKLTLVDLATREAVVQEGVRMTGRNRSAVLTFNDGKRPAKAEPSRVDRVHSESAPPGFADLAKAPVWAGWDGAASISAEAAARDLDQLEWLVEHTYSYRDLRSVNYRAAFDAVRLGLTGRVPTGAFGIQVARLLALFGDGHTRVRDLGQYQPTGYLPFLVADAEGGVVAFDRGRRGLIDPKYPFLVSLDGRPLDAWLGAATKTLAMGSEAFVRFHGLRNLRMLGANRVAAGMELQAQVEVVLANAAGKTRTLKMDVAARKPTYGPWPRTKAHRMLDGNVGYLRVASMDGDKAFIDGLIEAMGTFRETRGLIIDVRGNGGGSRDALRALYPYFLAPDGSKDSSGSSRVVNVGAYRLQPGEAPAGAEGYLSNRWMYPADFGRWSDAERQAITAAQEGFKADWTPDPKSFSEWHYCVLSAGGEFHYGRPVIVLMDSGCFSASDIFLGAFADLPSVTLMGMPSGGGSGRSDRATLAESGVAVQLSSMASFRSGGQRYDGRGIEVDVRLMSTASDYLLGGGDSVLAAALWRLR